MDLINKNMIVETPDSNYKFLVLNFVRGISNITEDLPMDALLFAKNAKHPEDMKLPCQCFYDKFIDKICDVADNTVGYLSAYENLTCPNNVSCTDVTFDDMRSTEIISALVNKKFDYNGETEVYDIKHSSCANATGNVGYYINAIKLVRGTYKGMIKDAIVSYKDTSPDESYSYYSALLNYSKILIPYIISLIKYYMYKLYIIFEADAINKKQNEASDYYYIPASTPETDHIASMVNGNDYANLNMNDAALELSSSDFYKSVSEYESKYGRKPKVKVNTVRIVKEPTLAIHEAIEFLFEDGTTDTTSNAISATGGNGTNNNTNTNNTQQQQQQSTFGNKVDKFVSGAANAAKKLAYLVKRFVQISLEVAKSNKMILDKAQRYDGPAGDVSNLHIPNNEAQKYLTDLLKAAKPINYDSSWQNNYNILKEKTESILNKDKSNASFPKIDAANSSEDGLRRYFDHCITFCLSRPIATENIKKMQAAYDKVALSRYSSPTTTTASTTTNGTPSNESAMYNEAISFLRETALSDPNLINIITECSDEEILDFCDLLDEAGTTTKQAAKNIENPNGNNAGDNLSDKEEYIKKVAVLITQIMTVYDTYYDLAIKYITAYMKPKKTN